MQDKRVRVKMQDDDAQAEAASFVDEDDYTIDCTSLDDTELVPSGRSLRQYTQD